MWEWGDDVHSKRWHNGKLYLLPTVEYLRLVTRVKHFTVGTSCFIRVKPRARSVPLALGLLLIPTFAFAVPQQYFDTLVGGRAALLGGAFTGLADDASATYYNPAGLASLPADNFSISGNAGERITYTIEKGLLGLQDVVRTSEANIPNAFSVVKKAGKSHLAFSIIGLLNTNFISSNKFNNLVFQGEVIDTVLRSETLSEEINLWGPSIAYTVRPGLMLGTTIYYVRGRSLFNQEISVRIDNPIIVSDYFTRRETTSQGVLAEIGMLAKPNAVTSLGLTLKSPTYLQEATSSRIKEYTFEASTSTSTANDPLLGTFRSPLRESEEIKAIYRPFGATLGLALQPSPGKSFSWDVSYYHSQNFTVLNQSVQIEPVFNTAFGYETFLRPNVPLRTGLYTNRTAAPKLNTQPAAQEDHVDYYGVTLGSGYIDTLSTLEIGVRYVYGTGQSKQVDPDGTVSLLNVNANVFTLYWASHFYY